MSWRITKLSFHSGGFAGANHTHASSIFDTNYGIAFLHCTLKIRPNFTASPVCNLFSRESEVENGDSYFIGVFILHM
jgi:hypothetical protein